MIGRFSTFPIIVRLSGAILCLLSFAADVPAVEAAAIQPAMRESEPSPEQRRAAEALLRIADLYYDGTLIASDLPRALDYYEQAAAAGSATGTVRAGEMIVRGLGTETDVGRGLAMIRSVAAIGNTDALISLGDLLASGEAGPIDAPAAIEAYTKAASFGDPGALVRLGDIYVKGDMVPADGTAAISAFEQAAALGSVEAMLRLGDVYFDGEAVPFDLSRAFQYYWQAAELGSGTGKVLAGEMLVDQQSAFQDVDRGLRLLNQQALAGNSSAFVALGDIYARGDVGVIDPGAAIEAYAEGAALGSARALIRLGDLYCSGIVVQQDCRKARQYYAQAAELDDPYADYILAAGDLEGLFGSSVSPEQAVGMLQMALERGVQDAAVALGDRLLNGWGVRRDINKAIAYLESAAEAGNGAAARRLVEIFRDGLDLNGSGLVRADPSKAQLYLDTYQAALTRNEIALEQLLLDVMPGSRLNDSIYTRLEALPPRYRQRAVRAMQQVNPNAFAFVVQRYLAQAGLFHGQANGLLTRATVAAIDRFCETRNAAQYCRHGPISGETASIIAFGF